MNHENSHDCRRNPDEVVKDAKSGVPAIGYALPGADNNIVFTIVGLILMSIL